MKKVALLAAALLACSVHAADGTLRAGVFDPPRAAPDFSLSGSDGNELNMSRYRGKVVLLGFGYSHCAAVCPITLATLAQAHKKLGATGKDLQVVYVTVDPERDSPARLREFLGHFDPSFVGGTGAPQALAAVREAYGISATRLANGFDHSSFIYLIDREGKIRAMMPYGHGADDYAHDVAILLRK